MSRDGSEEGGPNGGPKGERDWTFTCKFGCVWLRCVREPPFARTCDLLARL